MTGVGPLTLFYADAGPESGSLVGGKFSSLAEMSNAGFGVPAAFAVTTEAHRAFMKSPTLAKLVEKARLVDRDDLEAVERVSAEMIGATEETALPAGVAAAIAAAYTQLCKDCEIENMPVAVRSSGVAEDLAGASFAGQYDTYLWIAGVEDVLAHVRRCWAGLFGAAVLTYRPTPGASERESLGMAVVVQRMVQSRAAGVAFTLDPVTGDRSKVAIEAAWGLGEGVVSGEVTPDRFRVDKVTLEILERAIMTQSEEYRFEPGVGVGLYPVPEERQTSPALDDAEVSELATLAKRIERHRGAPQDIEWAVDQDHQFHVLQVRPETVWSQREAKPSGLAGRSALDLVLGSFMGAANRGKRGGGEDAA